MESGFEGFNILNMLALKLFEYFNWLVYKVIVFLNRYLIPFCPGLEKQRFCFNQHY